MTKLDEVKKAIVDYRMQSGQLPVKIFISILDYTKLVEELHRTYRFIPNMDEQISSTKTLFGLTVYRVIEDNVLVIC